MNVTKRETNPPPKEETIHHDWRRWAALTALLALLVVAAIVVGCAKGLDKTTRVPGQSYAAALSAATATPGSLPSPHEELWVIAQTRSISNPSRQPEPNSGAMCVKEKDELVAMPMKHTDVRAEIVGYLASVKVIQQFQNPYAGKIEAIYVFPLPENAAVNEFIMTIGERRIRGIIRERAEAEKIYREAKRQGYVASLLTQERPNIFTQSVANIEPGQAIDVTIQYFHTLAYDDGWYEFVFPMVVGPRFNPAGITDGVGAVARGKHGVSGQPAEVSYLAPAERSGHDIGLQVDVQAGVAIEQTRCTSHKVIEARTSSEHFVVSLSSDDAIPNKDFVLRYRVAGERIKSSLVTHRDQRGGFFTLMLYPPADLKSLSRQALELVFVLDCSGSMSGEPIAQAKAAIRRALERLQPGDSFQIINFSEKSSALGARPLEATPENIGRGHDYLARLNGDGPTMMIEGIKAALDFPHDPTRLRFVCFLTDGFIGNETEILAEVQRRIGASRIFSFGVGSAPNRYLLNGLARIGRGAVAYLGLKDDAKRVMDAFFDRVSHPALTDVQIDWAGLQVREVYPRQVPDLFVGRPVILTGRFDGQTDAVNVSGAVNGRRTSLPVAWGSERETTHPALPSVWARMKIAELSEQGLTGEGGGLATAIKQVALDYNLMSAYTAFIAVDSAGRTAGDTSTTVPVAVPVPEGVSYKKTVRE
jgi:Ca-activated chloride channel family protein